MVADVCCDNTDIAMMVSDTVFHYKTIAIIILDGNLLTVKHQDFPYYYMVGGRTTINETSQQAVVREVHEETGYITKVDRLCFVEESIYESFGTNFHIVSLHYLMKVSSDFTVADGKPTDQGEKEKLYWLPLKDLNKYDLRPSFLKQKLSDGIDKIIGIEHIVTQKEIHKGAKNEHTQKSINRP